MIKLLDAKSASHEKGWKAENFQENAMISNNQTSKCTVSSGDKLNPLVTFKSLMQSIQLIKFFLKKKGSTKVLEMNVNDDRITKWQAKETIEQNKEI